jgi:hypothetical protein
MWFKQKPAEAGCRFRGIAELAEAAYNFYGSDVRRYENSPFPYAS